MGRYDLRMTVFLGTSGWQYRDWKGTFYPPEVPQRRWLAHYAERFATVELNNSFYRLPPRERFAAWAAGTPEDFVVCPKVSRYLSHIRRLREPAEPVARFLDAAEGLGAKLGPALLQLPPNFRADLDRLDATLRAFAGRVPVAVELRHPSWFDAPTRRVLERHEAALCLADRGSRWVTPRWQTAPWGYVRFHAGGASPSPCYGRTALRSRGEAIAELYGDRTRVWAFFNNDPRGCAVRDARWFAAACRRAGLSPTRVPGTREVTIAT